MRKSSLTRLRNIAQDVGKAYLISRKLAVIANLYAGNTALGLTAFGVIGLGVGLLAFAVFSGD